MKQLSQNSLPNLELDVKNIKIIKNLQNTQPLIKILQIGDGNFLRAFVDWMVDIANEKNCFNAEITIVQPLAQGIAEKLNAQNNLFTVITRGINQGVNIVNKRIISCVKDAINPYNSWQKFLEVAQEPSLKFVISNTTEAGITYSAETYLENKCPNNFPAKMTAMLYSRFQNFAGDKQKGLIFLPCELIDKNGSNLKKHILQYSKDWQLSSEFSEWVESANVFCNTLVDRIVPGYPATEAEELQNELGYIDTLMVACELFHVWVIEAPPAVIKEFPLATAGLDVVWTENLQPYRNRKVRILNGAHTACSLAGFMMGLDTVRELTTDDSIARLLKQVMFDEIVPVVNLSESEKMEYAQTIIERFANPHIRHELISIALNSIAKWPVRVLPSLKDYVEKFGKIPRALAFSLSALIIFYQGEPKIATEKISQNINELIGKRNGEDYPIRDNAQNLSIIYQTYNTHRDTNDFVQVLLSDSRLWGEDLSKINGLVDVVAQGINDIKTIGIKNAIEKITK